MGISRRTYVRWETGASVPRVGPPLKSAAAVLRRSPMYLLFGTEGKEDTDGSD